MWFDNKKIENHIVTFGFKDDDGKRIGGGHTFLIYIEHNKYYYFENSFAPCANIVEFDSLGELIGNAIALYLIASNNTDKIDKIYATIDGHLSINSNTQQNYKDTINDKDVYNNYREKVENGLRKFQ